MHADNKAVERRNRGIRIFRASQAIEQHRHKIGELRARKLAAQHPVGTVQPAADRAAAIHEAYAELGRRYETEDVDVAVRSSATAEDLPDASFAGQQDTYLNITGADDLMRACKDCFASVFTDRAIAYRVHHGFEHADVALSAGVQRMVRSDVGASGVMFTMDTESGFTDAVFVTASYGLGEAVVQGAVNPDEWYVWKPGLAAGTPAVLKRGVGGKATKMVFTEDPNVGKTTEFVDVDAAERVRFSLTDEEVVELARLAVSIEQHYGRPMDIEWAKDGIDGKLYILQARPETVQSRRSAGSQQRYRLGMRGEVLIEGRAIGQKIGAGPVRVLSDVQDMHQFVPGEVLVADMTDPDWEPIMKRASAIVTNRGGRTCHAAIIARELGIPAVVGTGTATTTLTDGQEVTVSAAEGDTGLVYDGLLDFEVETTELSEMPEIPVKIMMNVGTPEQAFAFSRLPHRGVGLARLEFIINRQIGVHPKALLDLCFALQDEASITPYYFYMCDMIPFAEHWRLSLAEAQHLQHAMMGYLPGFATPRIVCDVPFVGKRWVHQVESYDIEKGMSYWRKNYRTSIEGDDTEATSRDYVYYDPIHTLPESGQKWWRTSVDQEVLLADTVGRAATSRAASESQLLV